MEPEVRNKLDLAIEIRDVYAREILDFAGNPAIEVEVLAGGEIIGKASMAGKNYSKKEQTEKQQVHIEEKIELLNSQIAPEIIGENVFEQRKIDTILKENGNEQTSFAISLAVARAAAAAEKIPLYRYLGGVRAVHPSMPQLVRKEEIEIEKIKEIKVDESTILGKLFSGVLQNVITGSETVTENLKVVLQIQDIGMLFLLGGAVILVALCCSILPILRANPKDILAKMEG